MCNGETVKTREQYRAWDAVRRALRKGALVRPDTCERCGRRPGVNKRGRSLIEAHHHKGYSTEYKLSVVFLCVVCHKRADLLARYPPSKFAAGLIERLYLLRAERERSGQVIGKGA